MPAVDDAPLPDVDLRRPAMPYVLDVGIASARVALPRGRRPAATRPQALDAPRGLGNGKSERLQRSVQTKGESSRQTREFALDGSASGPTRTPPRASVEMSAVFASNAGRVAPASTSGAARRDASRAARLPPAGRFRHPRISRRPDASASATSTSPDALAPVKAAVFAAVEGTEKGLSCTDAQRAAVEAAVSALEACNPTTRPAASELQAGNWEVVYSTAPPPSNGSLGPFRGVAYQDINFADKSYVNVLSVPPADWLGARLVADWAPAEGDEDDRVWIVSFREVSVRLLGFRLFTKTFDNTTRVWDQTYVDEDTRVVRAARTMEGLTRAAARGRTAVAGDEDDCVFVMRRVPESR